MLGLGIGELIFFYTCGTIFGGASTIIAFALFTEEGREHAKKTICKDLGIGLDEKGRAKLSKKYADMADDDRHHKMVKASHREI